MARMSDDEDGPQNVCDVVLSTISMWVEKVPAREVETLAMKHFGYEKMKAAATGVKPFAECSIPHGEQPDVLARNLVAAVMKICQEAEPKVVFLVRSIDLFSVPGVESSLMPLDVSAVGARLLGMEASLETLSTSLKGMANLEKTVETLAGVVTNLKEQQRQENDVAIARQVGSAAVGNVPGSYAAAVSGRRVGEGAAENQLKRKRGPASATSPRQQTPRRPDPATPPSALFKEALELNGVQGVSQMLREERQRSDEHDGFTLAVGNRRRQRRQANLLQGASEVVAGGGLPTPFSVFIRNTDPNYTEGDIKRYLEECAAAMPEEEKLKDGLQIIQVRNIPIKRLDGAPLRSKCWKVTVDEKCKDHMLKPRAYPSRWSARQWYGSRNWQENSGQSTMARVTELQVPRPNAGETEAGNEKSNTGAAPSSAASVSSMVVA